jgi:hypothetical protein
MPDGLDELQRIVRRHDEHRHQLRQVRDRLYDG